ncbi:PAS domain S-box protein [Kordia sp. YSTF-M3]|uniref:histidine kinase n=1 Tax=Kordia aestuariivivens TaxID=2759037 RepID=A0ABR7QFR4_9FLAO|nr:ATP-binding protein [Kordia aestuariivivens]MBC8757221.1 PAS domain S-box protein [Kordia aestuariivivens]
MIVLNTKGIIAQLNKRFDNSFQSDTLYIGKPLQNFVLDKYEAILKEIINKVASGETILKQHLKFPTNTSKGILTLRLDFYLEDTHIYAVGTDVTQDDKERQALEAISALGKIAAWYYNPITEELFWSRECYKMHGIDPNDTDRDEKGFYNYAEEIQERAKKYLYELLETKQRYDYIETVTKQGAKTYLRIAAEPVLHNNKIIFVNGTVADVTERQEYIEQLKESEETKRLALKGIRSGLFDHMIETNMVYYSPSFRRMLGLPLKEEFLPEEEFRKMIHPEDVEAALTRHLENLEKEDAYYFNYYRLRHLDGEYLHYEVYGYCKKDANGHTTRMIGNLINVNERKKSEQTVLRNQRHLQAIINNGFVYTFLLDANGNILMTDEASAKIIVKDFNINPNKVSVRFMDILPLNFKNTYADSFNEALKGHISRKEVERVTSQGHSQWLEVKYTPITDDTGSVTAVLISSLDITEQKMAEIAIKEAHLKEQELNSFKTNILANFSHEIRTPLNGIMAISQLLITEEDAEERNKLLAYLDESKDRLLETVTNLSNFSEIEAIKTNLNLTKCDLNFTVESSFREYDHLAEVKALDYKLILDKSSPKVAIDEQLFRTAFNNIVHNAIKYTQEGTITVSIATDETRTNALISVKDTGIGMEAANLTKIFDPFVQESIGMSRKYEGTGIGLSLSKRYIEILNGSIEVNSELAKGSEFIIKLPLYS